MPEIWLNYGQNEVVLDIQAENLDERIEFEQPVHFSTPAGNTNVDEGVNIGFSDLLNNNI